MSFDTPNPRPIACPRCKARLSYADIVFNELEKNQIKLGNASRVVLEPCFCNATTRDPDFFEMLKTVERFNNSPSSSIKIVA